MKQKRTKKDEPASPPAPKGGFRHSIHADIPEDALTFREQKVLKTLRATTEPLTVRELARKCFPGMRAKAGTYESTHADGATVRHGTGAAYRCVLNSLRRLVAGGFALKADRGSYAAVRVLSAEIPQEPSLETHQADTKESHHE